MSGRCRLEIGTYGDISTIRTGSGTIRAEARYRDGGGTIRKVTASAGTAKQAKQAGRLAQDAAFESRARRMRGWRAVSLESLVVQIATTEVVQELPMSRLTVQDAQRAARLAQLRILIQVEQSPSRRATRPSLSR